MYYKSPLTKKKCNAGFKADVQITEAEEMVQEDTSTCIIN